jgi:hypothetical protein
LQPPAVEPAEPPGPPRARATLTVAVEAREAFRGDALRVRGRLTVEGGDPAGAKVLLELVGGGGAVPLGEAVTDGSGQFAADLEIPRAMPLGDHRLIARTEGDAKRLPARSAR